MDLVHNILALIAAVRAKDWGTAITLTLEIIEIIRKGFLPQPMFALGAGLPLANAQERNDLAYARSQSAADLIDDIERCCKTHNMTAGTAPTGPFINLIWPKLLALLLKLLGF